MRPKLTLEFAYTLVRPTRGGPQRSPFLDDRRVVVGLRLPGMAAYSDGGAATSGMAAYSDGVDEARTAIHREKEKRAAASRREAAFVLRFAEEARHA